MCLLLPFAILPSPEGEFTTVASWYGPGFQGRRTASGETFDTNKMTAASRDLPFGTKVLVTNPRNGRTCQVTINDRGPYVKGRDIDLSHAAAQRLGISGIAPVVCYTGAAQNLIGKQSQEDSDLNERGSSPEETGDGRAMLAAYRPAAAAPTPYRYRTPIHGKELRTAPSQYVASRPANRMLRRADRSQQYIAYNQSGRLLVNGAHASHYQPNRSPQYIAYHQSGRSFHNGGARHGAADRSRQYIAYPQPAPPIPVRRDLSQQFIASRQTERSKFRRAFDHIGHGVGHLYKAVKYGIIATL